MTATPVVYWDGRRPALPGRLDRRFPLGPRSRNFGDLLGPLVVAGVHRGDVPAVRAGTRVGGGARGRRLLTVGSILHYARDDDVVWGTGVNGKVPRSEHRFHRLDVRAVRGPLTRRVLADLGVDAPEVYGDPGLLVPVVLPHLVEVARDKTRGVTVVPHLSEVGRGPLPDGYLSPRAPLHDVLAGIARSERVVTSSLHGVVVADALGVPVQLVRPRRETLFKYEDYFAGTSRDLPPVYDDVGAALRAPVQAGDPVHAPPALLAAFPYDLFDDDRDPATAGGPDGR